MANEIMLGDIGVVEANPKIAVTRGDNSAARNIQAAGEIGGDLVLGLQQARTRTAVGDTAQALSAAEQIISSREKLGFDAGQEEVQIMALEEGMSKRARDSFSKIRAGLDQQGGGRGPAARKAILLAEKEIRNISALTPGFAQNIRQTAAEVLGFDPTGATMERLFGMQDPKVEKQPSKSEMLKDLMGNLYETDFGRTVQARMDAKDLSPQVAYQEAIDDGSLQAVNNMHASRIRTENGEQNVQDFATDYVTNLGKSTSINGFIDQVRAGLISKEGLRAMDQQSLLLEIDNIARAAKNGFLTQVGGMENVRLEPATVQFVNQQIDSQLEGLKDFVSNSNSLEFLKEHIGLLENKGLRGIWEGAPEIMTLAQMPGNSGDTLIKLIHNSADWDTLRVKGKNFPEMSAFYTPEGLQEISKYVKGSSMAVLGGMPNNNPAPTPELQDEVDRYVAQSAIENGGLQDKNVAANLRNNKPKIVFSSLAKKPSLINDLAPEEVKPYRAKYMAQAYLLAKSAARTMVDEGAVAEVGSVRRAVPAEQRGVGDPAFTKEEAIRIVREDGSEFLWNDFPEANVVNNVMLPIMEQPGVSRRLFEGTRINPANSKEVFVNLMNMTGTEVKMDRVDRQIEGTTNRILTGEQRGQDMSAERERLESFKNTRQTLKDQMELYQTRLGQVGFVVPGVE